MERTIGLGGAVVTLVGFVIGVSVFLLPGELAASAGPGVVISYGIASVMALFSCVISAQIGAIFPTSGASFVYSTKMTSPFFGFLMIWSLLCGVAMAIALVAHGFAVYFDLFFPGLNKTIVAVAVVLLFAVINLFGANASVRAQSLMVIVFMTVLLIFSAVGVFHIDSELLVPFVPNGYESVLLAAVPAVFSFSGFFVIVEIGGEIKNPSRTIPLSLLISFILVWLCYTGVSLVIVGQIPWQELANNDAPVATVAGLIFPRWATTVITLTILAASATSINGILLGYSRDLYALSRVDILPKLFSKVSVNHAVPHNSIILLTVMSLLAVLIGAKISEYATVVVLALMVSQVVLGVATLRLPRVMPARLANVEFQISSFWRSLFAWGIIVLSFIFLYVGAQGSPISVAVLGAIVSVGVIYYLLRRRFMNSRDIDMEKSVMDHIEVYVAKVERFPGIEDRT